MPQGVVDEPADAGDVLVTVGQDAVGDEHPAQVVGSAAVGVGHRGCRGTAGSRPVAMSARIVAAAPVRSQFSAVRGWGRRRSRRRGETSSSGMVPVSSASRAVTRRARVQRSQRPVLVELVLDAAVGTDVTEGWVRRSRSSGSRPVRAGRRAGGRCGSRCRRRDGQGRVVAAHAHGPFGPVDGGGRSDGSGRKGGAAGGAAWCRPVWGWTRSCRAATAAAAAGRGGQLEAVHAHVGWPSRARRAIGRTARRSRSGVRAGAAQRAHSALPSSSRAGDRFDAWQRTHAVAVWRRRQLGHIPPSVTDQSPAGAAAAGTGRAG
jgi:hypothetical protein